jgi:hypothetical protein
MVVILGLRFRRLEVRILPVMPFIKPLNYNELRAFYFEYYRYIPGVRTAGDNIGIIEMFYYPLAHLLNKILDCLRLLTPKREGGLFTCATIKAEFSYT